MTELEKKANLYADEHYDDTDEYGNWFTDLEMLRRAYIAGAKEMLKENAISERIIIGEQIEIDRLEKENKELKLLSEKMETWINRIRELKEENEQLKQSNWELLKKIEKMKNCYNCESYIDDDAYDLCKFCNEFSKWELADDRQEEKKREKF